MTDREQGSITPLVIGLAAVVALLVAVVVDSSAAFLRREGLNAVADAAALAATDGLQGSRAYTGGLEDAVALDLATARRSVAEHLEVSGALRRYNDLTWAVSVSGRYVVVRLRASVELPLPVPGTDARVQVAASSSAQVSVGD